MDHQSLLILLGLIVSLFSLMASVLKIRESLGAKKSMARTHEPIHVYNINLVVHNSPGVTIKVKGPKSPTS